MFKPISSSLKRKERTYEQNREELRDITQVMGVFFMSALGISLQDVGIRCEWTGEELTIQTNSKALANELTVRLNELTKFLQERGIRPVRIIIR